MPKACDSCSVRKIKCSGSPCDACREAGVVCSSIRAFKKPGPKGPRSRTRQAIRNLQSSSDHGSSQPSNSPAQSTSQHPHAHAYGPPSYRGSQSGSTWNNDQQPPQNPRSHAAARSIALHEFHTYLRHFTDRLSFIWPVLDVNQLLARLHDETDHVSYALATAICGATIAQLQIATHEHRHLPLSMAYDAERTRFLLDYHNSQLVDALLTCFFLHVLYSNIGKSTKALVCLREAITYAHILGIHQDAFYADLSDNSAQSHLRIAWILFITDKAHAMQHNVPATFSLSPTLPPLHQQDGSNEAAFHSLCNLFHTYDAARPPSNAPSHGNFLNAISTQLLRAHESRPDDNEVQRADIAVTDAWLRVVLWKEAIPHIGSGSDPNDPGLSMSFPISESRDLLSKLGTVSIQAIETHGPGMMFKLVEVASLVADIITCAPGLADTGPMQVGPHDIFHTLSSLISSLRTSGEPALLQLLQEKIISCTLAQMGPPERLLQITDIPDEELQHSRSPQVIEL